MTGMSGMVIDKKSLEGYVRIRFEKYTSIKDFRESFLYNMRNFMEAITDQDLRDAFCFGPKCFNTIYRNFTYFLALIHQSAANNLRYDEYYFTFTIDEYNALKRLMSGSFLKCYTESLHSFRTFVDVTRTTEISIGNMEVSVGAEAFHNLFIPVAVYEDIVDYLEQYEDVAGDIEIFKDTMELFDTSKKVAYNANQHINDYIWTFDPTVLESLVFLLTIVRFEEDDE